MKSIIQRFFFSRLFAFLLKEFRQTARNKLLLYLLLVPPTVQLLILGAALDPELHHMRLGVCDQSNSVASRRLEDSLSGSAVFDVVEKSDKPEKMTHELEQGKISGLVFIPATFESTLARDKKASFQTLLDGGDAYTARVANADLRLVLAHFAPIELANTFEPVIKNETRVLYNPGLKSTWYIVPGILGSVLTLMGTLVSSAVLLRERELGTLEQLLMTPAAAGEIIFAKMAPLVVLLLGDVVLALILSSIFFGLPMRGNLFTFFLGTSFYVCVCVSAGILLGTFCRSQRQAQLCSFFINIPIIQLSGSVVPFESMPEFMQKLASLDPLRYYALFARASLLKGAEIDALWPYLLILAIAAALLLSVSTMRFRRQLG